MGVFLETLWFGLFCFLVFTALLLISFAMFALRSAQETPSTTDR